MVEIRGPALLNGFSVPFGFGSACVDLTKGPATQGVGRALKFTQRATKSHPIQRALGRICLLSEEISCKSLTRT